MTTKLVDTMKEALAKKQSKLAPENKKSGSTKDSIKSQTYNNFEVIVTDDSPNNSVELLCKEFEVYFTIRYYKNNPIK